jgi:hypothetical protein
VRSGVWEGRVCYLRSANSVVGVVGVWLSVVSFNWWCLEVNRFMLLIWGDFDGTVVELPLGSPQ